MASNDHPSQVRVNAEELYDDDVDKAYEFEEESTVKQWLEQAALNGAEGTFSFHALLQLPNMTVPVKVFVSEPTRSGHVKVDWDEVHKMHGGDKA